MLGRFQWEWSTKENKIYVLDRLGEGAPPVSGRSGGVVAVVWDPELADRITGVLNMSGKDFTKSPKGK